MCPSTSQWNLRASAICLEKNSYACLLNRKHEKYNENCQGPDDVESGKGYMIVEIKCICYSKMIMTFVINRCRENTSDKKKMLEKKSK